MYQNNNIINKLTKNSYSEISSTFQTKNLNNNFSDIQNSTHIYINKGKENTNDTKTNIKNMKKYPKMNKINNSNLYIPNIPVDNNNTSENNDNKSIISVSSSYDQSFYSNFNDNIPIKDKESKSKSKLTLNKEYSIPSLNIPTLNIPKNIKLRQAIFNEYKKNGKNNKKRTKSILSQSPDKPNAHRQEKKSEIEIEENKKDEIKDETKGIISSVNLSIKFKAKNEGKDTIRTGGLNNEEENKVKNPPINIHNKKREDKVDLPDTCYCGCMII